MARRSEAFLVSCYAVSGFVAMLYEVAWSRALVLVLGSSTYAYTAMLTTFLLGLALGAALAIRWLKRAVNPLASAGLCQVLVALATYASVLLLGELPYLYLRAQPLLPPSPTALVVLQFLMAGGLLLLPTLGLGAMFPITLRGLGASGATAARTVGSAYALNTLGGIGGAVLGGFWLVPALGAQQTLMTGILLNTLLALGAVLMVKSQWPSLLRVSAAVALVAFGLTVALSTTRWNPASLSAGVFVYGAEYHGLSRQGFLEKAHRLLGRLLMFEEGLTRTVTVSRTPAATVLKVNGKPDATTPSGLTHPLDADGPKPVFDMPTQVLLGQLPMLFAPQREQVLVIGLSSGVTLGSALTHPVQRVECLELDNAVVRGSQWFDAVNGQPLSDPRTKLILNDARNHLLVTDQHYDVIISEPSSPWILGATHLLTREFFELSRLRLRTGGVFCQRIQLDELQPEHFQAILRTFIAVFPNIHMFRVNHDAILVASKQPCALRLDELSARRHPQVARDFARIQMPRWEDLMGRYWIGGEELRQAVAAGPLNTDDNMLIEFAAPLQVLAGQRRSVADEIDRGFMARSTGAVPHLQLNPQTDASAFWAAAGEAALDVPLPEPAREYAHHSMRFAPNPKAGIVLARLHLLRGHPEEAHLLLDDLERTFPQATELVRALAVFHASQGHWADVQRCAERTLAVEPENAIAQFHLARALYHLDDFSRSLALLEPLKLPKTTDVLLADAPYYLAATYWKLARHADAIPHFRTYLKRNPGHVEAREQLADALFHTGKASEAAVVWAGIGRENAADARRLITQALDAGGEHQSVEPARLLDQARTLDPTSVEATLHAARLCASRSDWNEAAGLLEDFLAKNPDSPLAVGYLSQVWAKQGKAAPAQALADHYHMLTGKPWQTLAD